MKSPTAMKRAVSTLRNEKCASPHILRSKMLHGGQATASRERKRVLYLILPLRCFYAIMNPRGDIMKRFISIFLVLILSVSLSGCASLGGMLESILTSSGDSTESVDSAENAKKFYDKVNESKILIDLVATDVCAAWKDAQSDYSLSTKDVNDAIEKAKNAHSENITKINEFDTEIRELFDKAKNEMKELSAEYALKEVMTAYSEYKDSVLNANEALDSSGYIGVSVSKDSLDRALENLFVEL